jgi:hypothetical protein
LARQLGVKYIYHPMVPTAVAAPELLTAQPLRRLTTEQREELHAAVECLDSERIGEVIGHISKVDADLGGALAQLAGKFDYPAILGALDTATLE